MPTKRKCVQTQRDSRREFLERKSTEELLADIDPMTRVDQRKMYIGGGGKTIIQQILSARGVTGGNQGE
jgi:hypothetical protein